MSTLASLNTLCLIFLNEKSHFCSLNSFIQSSSDSCFLSLKSFLTNLSLIFSWVSLSFWRYLTVNNFFLKYLTFMRDSINLVEARSSICMTASLVFCESTKPSFLSYAFPCMHLVILEALSALLSFLHAYIEKSCSRSLSIKTYSACWSGADK